MKQTLLLLFFSACLLQLHAQTATTDEQAVERAMLDYLEGFYEGDTTKIIRGVLQEANKYGYWKDEESGAYEGMAMTFEEMKDFARGVLEKKRFPRPDAPKKVEIYEVLDQTASGKVTAWWGSDYILLGKYDGQWKIVHVLWQGPPQK